MTRVVRLHEAGGPEVLRVDEIDVRDPAPGEVRVRVEAIGVNRSDSTFRSGHHPVKPVFPSMLGSEAAGRVERLGEGVTEFAIGDAVSVVPRMAPAYGTYGELIIAPAEFLVRHPENFSMIQAAALWAPFLTAHGGLFDKGDMKEGDVVILTAASSSVGLAAIQLVNMAGGVPIATTRSRDKAQALLDAGAAHVIVTDEEDVAARVAEITAGKGARLVFDAVAGPGAAALAQSLAMGGRYIIYGMLSSEPTPFPVGLSFARGLTMETYIVASKRPLLDRAIGIITDGVARGLLSPIVARTFPLEESVAAHRYMESNAQFGKIIITVD